MQGLVKSAPGPGNLDLAQVPDPQPGPGQVLVEVLATGVCGTDLHIWDGEYAASVPVVIGHETAGRIVALGEGAEAAGLSTGDLVTSMTFFSTCGRCEYCRAGRPNLCPERRSIGTHVNGAFARFLVTPAANALRLPSGVDALAGALTEPLACCVHGVFDLARPEPGSVVVVSGPGPVGLLAAQVAREAGAEVVVLGTAGDDHRLALARELGLERVMDVSRQAPDEVVGQLTGGRGADLVIECAGAGSSLAQALSLAQKGGTLLQIGLYGKPISADFDQIAYKELRVLGSFGQVPSAWRRALELMAAGRVQTRPLVTDIYPLTKWRTAFATARAKSAGKIVLCPDPQLLH